VVLAELVLVDREAFDGISETWPLFDPMYRSFSLCIRSIHTNDLDIFVVSDNMDVVQQET